MSNNMKKEVQTIIETVYTYTHIECLTINKEKLTQRSSVILQTHEILNY